MERSGDMESRAQRDRRVEELWRKLDPEGRRELDLKGLQRGFKMIDHGERASVTAHAAPCMSDRRLQH